MWQPRLLGMMVACSLAAHAAALLWIAFGPHSGSSASRLKHPFRLVYESKTVHEEGSSVDVRARLRQLPAPSTNRSLKINVPVTSVNRDIGVLTGVRDPGGAGSSNVWGSPLAGSGAGGTLANAIDLTDIVSAARGDPVSLTYFGAIREQIQRVADGQNWLPDGKPSGGLVYVSFMVDRQGRIQSARPAAEEPEVLAALGDLALQIVKASAPFPEFPPSFDQQSLAIRVPLDFSTTQ
jgi:hypothetical protein